MGKGTRYTPTRLERTRIDNYAQAVEGSDRDFFDAVKERISDGYASRTDFIKDADECDRRYRAYVKLMGYRK